MRRFVVATSIALVSLTACHHAPASEPAPKPPCAGPTVLVADGAETDCDVLPGQRLDVLGLTGEGCADAGGRQAGIICEGVDF